VKIVETKKKRER